MMRKGDHMSRYSGMAKAKIVESGNYLRPGLSLLLEICRVYEVAPGYNLKTFAFCVDLDVIECKATSPTAEPHSIGEGVNFFRAMDPSKEAMWLPDVKAFMLAALGISHKRTPALVASISDAEFDALTQAAVGEGNPLEGVRVYCDTIGKPTRPTPQNPQGGVFTKHMWGPDEDRSGQWVDTKRLILAGTKTGNLPAPPSRYTQFSGGHAWDPAAGKWEYIGKSHPEYRGSDK